MSANKVIMISVEQDLIDYAKKTPITDEELRAVNERLSRMGSESPPKQSRGLLFCLAAFVLGIGSFIASKLPS